MKSLGQEELDHLNSIVWRGRLWLVLTLGTAWMGVNPFTIFFMCLFLLNKWLLMHHVGHGGHDKVPGVPAKFKSKNYAMGWRRFIDWPDWMVPEAWNYEHNYLLNYFTGEKKDPDLVEDNVKLITRLKNPLWRYVSFVVSAITWTFSYYAPNTIYDYAKKDLSNDIPIIKRYNLMMIIRFSNK